jgi:hypothetical protein
MSAVATDNESDALVAVLEVVEIQLELNDCCSAWGIPSSSPEYPSPANWLSVYNVPLAGTM